MDPKITTRILFFLICPLLEWLSQEAKKADTPIDDITVAILRGLLCKK